MPVSHTPCRRAPRCPPGRRTRRGAVRDRRVGARVRRRGRRLALAGKHHLVEGEVRRRDVRVHEGDRGHLLHRPDAEDQLGRRPAQRHLPRHLPLRPALDRLGGGPGEVLRLQGRLVPRQGCPAAGARPRGHRRARPGRTAQLGPHLARDHRTAHGRTPILYFSPYFWIDHLGNATNFTHYPLWIAHYTSGHPLVPGGWQTWTFWQRTSSGSVRGIGGHVDMNRFNGSSAQLAKIANSSGGGSGPPPSGPTVPVGRPRRQSRWPRAPCLPASTRQ